MRVFHIYQITIVLTVRLFLFDICKWTV